MCIRDRATPAAASSRAGRSWWSSRPGSLDGVPGSQRLQQARHQWGLDQRGRAEPFRFSRVVAGMKLAVADRGDVVSDLVRHVARSGAADRAEQSADVDLQAGFLAHLAGHGLLDRLAGLQPAAAIATIMSSPTTRPRRRAS